MSCPYYEFINHFYKQFFYLNAKEITKEDVQKLVKLCLE